MKNPTHTPTLAELVENTIREVTDRVASDALDIIEVRAVDMLPSAIKELVDERVKSLIEDKLEDMLKKAVEQELAQLRSDMKDHYEVLDTKIENDCISQSELEDAISEAMNNGDYLTRDDLRHATIDI